jgi:hypothetical protein
LFAAPNMTGIMNSLPPAKRGAGSGMRATFQNTGMVLSIGVFFSLMIVGLASTMPHTMATSLQANGVPHARAVQLSHLPPVGSLFAAFLGYNPMKQLLGSPHAAGVTQAQFDKITSKTFFPHLISSPFMTGLRIAFTASLVMCLIAAAASWMRGKKYVHSDVEEEQEGAAAPMVPVPEEWVPA